MATVFLNRPAENSTTIINELGERYVLAFPGKEAILTKEGENLVYGFEDGGKIVVEGFYSENSNSRNTKFELEGREFDAEKFFAAMDEPDLIPAAGPEQQQPKPTDSNSYHEYDDIGLEGGLDHLNGLDYTSEAAAASGIDALRADADVVDDDAQGVLATSADVRDEGHAPLAPPILPTPTPTPMPDPTPTPVPTPTPDEGLTPPSPPQVPQPTPTPTPTPTLEPVPTPEPTPVPDDGRPSPPQEPERDPLTAKVEFEQSEDGVHVKIIISEPPTEDPADVTYTINGEEFTATVEPGQTEIVHPDPVPVPPNPYGDPTHVDVTVPEITGGGLPEYPDPAEGDGDFTVPPTDVQLELNVERDPDNNIISVVTIDQPPREDLQVTITLPDGSTKDVIIPAGMLYWEERKKLRSCFHSFFAGHFCPARREKRRK